MSSQDHKAIDTEFEHEIVRYLRDHPAFFENHQDLLAGMLLTHESGPAVSLIERQVQVLREQKEELKAKLQSLINTAQINEKLNNNINSLILELLDAASLKDVIKVIEQRIRADFEADAIVVKLLASGNEVLKQHEDLTAWQQPALAIGEKVMTARQPVCGSFNPEQMQALFDDADIQSAGVVPLAADKDSKNCYGIIAIGSYDPQRFRADMGTLFLSLLGQVLTRILKQHLQE
ncbi:MAG: DUF484 family protein [Gammaproteobacteria bacterium]|nr:DUF484 family protein [Gammaproteobacteria bacterium]